MFTCRIRTRGIIILPQIQYLQGILSLNIILELLYNMKYLRIPASNGHYGMLLKRTVFLPHCSPKYQLTKGKHHRIKIMCILFH